MKPRSGSSQELPPVVSVVSAVAAELAVDQHPPQPYPTQQLRAESVSKQQQQLAQHGPAIMGIFHIINVIVIFIVFEGVVESFVLEQLLYNS